MYVGIDRISGIGVSIYLDVFYGLFLVCVCRGGGGQIRYPVVFPIAVPKPFGVRIGNFWTLLRIDSLTL